MRDDRKFDDLSDRLTYRTLKGSELREGMQLRSGDVLSVLMGFEESEDFSGVHRVMVLRKPFFGEWRIVRVTENQGQYRVKYKGLEPDLYTFDN